MKTKCYVLKVSLGLWDELMKLGPDRAREALAKRVGKPSLAASNKPGRPKGKK
jgi:hypothetical protein